MLVRHRMSRYPITINPEASLPDAMQLMQGSKVRRLPVLNEKDELVGIVAQEDLFRAMPSIATSLSKHEINYLLEEIKVKNVMTHNVITVTEDTPLEEASRILSDNRISALPVVRDGKLVGMISEEIIGNVLAEVFGARKPGVRLTVLVPRAEGTLAKITKAITDLGGHFIAFGETERPGTDQMVITMKVQSVPRDTLTAAVRPLVLDIEDVRESE